MIDTDNLQKALNQLGKEKKPVIVKAKDDAFNRKMLETGKIDILLDLPNNSPSKLKEASSGLNHVLANIAKKNNVAIGVDLEKITRLPSREKSIALEKLRQNIKFIDKKKLNLAIFNAKSKHQTLALLKSLGSSSTIANRTQYF